MAKVLQTSHIARLAPGTKAPARPTASTPSLVDSSAKDIITSNRARTLLPQRSNTVRDDGATARLPPTERRPRETSPRRPQIPEKQGTPSTATPSTGATASARRQSLMRPVTLKSASTRSNVSAPTKPATPTFTPPSPRKPPMRSPTQVSTAPRPPSPKKAEMPPPPRPARSFSLRQPVKTDPTAVKGHARHRSQMIPSNIKTIPTDSAQKPRAGFSSYQQQYASKKLTKPPTPTPGDTSASGDHLIPTTWPDIAALQTELLQLSLFHSNTLEKHAEWKMETESNLRTKYDTVAGQYRSTQREEQMRQSKLNTQTLGSWSQNCRDHNGPHGFPEQIQILSQILQEVSDLDCTTTGRYARVVAIFEDWIDRAEDTRSRRQTARVLDGIDFIEPLDPRWKEEVRGLQAKLELCARQLQTLDILGFGEVERLEQSALTRVARGLVESIQVMMQEVRAMQTVEAEMVGSERETVGRLATQLTSIPTGETRTRVGVWQA
ncbi:hypothetical protein N7466_003643 [Penicillium verhagenii]|uniref:uncharacterized protein n=1 Tax=Penicillium verhagenii TaxID=1562060 RepID=UPI0025455AB7|nr:uncharacterized protein N7466_003643 [Penicillium verhagenii]KAJ5934096.1 hypothetical protein N7466_003643 [Penicillium verhagenii]